MDCVACVTIALIFFEYLHLITSTYARKYVLFVVLAFKLYFSCVRFTFSFFRMGGVHAMPKSTALVTTYVVILLSFRYFNTLTALIFSLAGHHP